MNKDILTDLYQNQRLSTREVGSILNLSHKTVAKWVKRHKVSKHRPLTQKQKELIIGSLLGDGCITKNKNDTLGRLEINHSNKQKDYLVLKSKVLSPLVRNIRQSEIKLKDRVYNTVGVKTLTHPEFILFERLFYKDRSKYININIRQYITPFSLAIWLQDDGSFHKPSGKIRISTDCFSYSDHLLLKDMLNDFDLIVNICCGKRKGSLYYYLEFNKTNAIKLKNIVRPNIIESMKYKLGE